MKKILRILFVLGILASCKPTNNALQNKESFENFNGLKTDSIWTFADRLNYSKKNQDSTLWDLEKLKEDLTTAKSRTWPTNSAISNYPSPVSKYDWGFCLLYNLELEIEGKLLKGACIAYAKDKYRIIENSEDFYTVKFNILVLTDLQEPEMGSKSVVSRNYPHYLSTGKQKTKNGDIDWVQMSLANGKNFAIISQRYFDLEFGNTIVVVPFKDGSIRFLQLKNSIYSFSQNPFSEVGKEKVAKFYNQLKENSQLIDLLKNKNIIEQKM